MTIKYEVTLVMQHNPPGRDDEAAVVLESEWMPVAQAEAELARQKVLNCETKGGE